MRKKITSLKTLLIAAGLCMGSSSAWADETRTLVYSNDFEESSDWTANGKTDGWRVNPGTTTANTFNSKVIGNGSGAGDMGLYSPSMSFSSGITIVDVEMKFKMDACTKDKGSGIEFVQPSGVTIGGGYISAGTPFFSINASANGNGYWGSINVGGTDYTSILNQTGTYENNSLNRNTTGIVVLNARFNFKTKETTFTLKKTDGTVLVASTTVAFGDDKATSLDKIFIHAGKGYGGVTIDDVAVYSVTTSETYANYTVHFVDNNGATIKEDVVRSGVVGSTVNANTDDVATFYNGGYKYVYANDGGGVKVNSNGNAEFTVTYTKYGQYTYTLNAVDGDNNVLKQLATGEQFEGESATVYFNKALYVNSKWYSTTNACNWTFTEAATSSVTYTEDANIDYFFEVEDINKSRDWAATGSYPDRYSNGKAGRLYKGAYAYTDALEGGVYNLTLWGRNQAGTSTAAIGVFVRNPGGTETKCDNQFEEWEKGAQGLKTIEITIPTGSCLVLRNENTEYNSNLEMDYIILKKTGDAPVVNKTATIGATGYTSFASAWALDLDQISGGTAFYASEVGESSVTLKEATGTVAAGTGLILKGTAGATVTIPVAVSGDPIAGNLLVGCTSEQILTANADLYVLVNNGGTAEFQSLEDNGATIPAGKAYLNAKANGAKLRIAFEEDDATAIKAIATEEVKDNVIYNLSGQRVVKPLKGIYIQNGKKILVK